MHAIPEKVGNNSPASILLPAFFMNIVAHVTFRVLAVFNQCVLPYYSQPVSSNDNRKTEEFIFWLPVQIASH
ncbi:hypothetical protein CW304_05695 [Bacillus sp. UFRGS-B20]|nr:hypothetical protein CW304_05695 [Bacillus sp. UFRGS-B20]